MKQQTSEPVDTYLTGLKAPAQKCNFSTPSALEDVEVGDVNND